MENESEKWLTDMLAFPMDEPVTVKIMQAPLLEIKKRLAFVTEKLKEIGKPDSSEFHLLVTEKENDSYWYKIDGQKPVTIGRSLSSDLVINHPEISRTHSKILKENGEFKIIDLSSRNGLIVNDKKVSERFLCNGDFISLGTWSLVFVEPREPW